MLWTDHEIQTYRLGRNSDIDLRILYMQAPGGPILNSNPEKRAKYLAENVLHLSLTDHDVIMRLAEEKGRPAALKFLEQLTINSLD